MILQEIDSNGYDSFYNYKIINTHNGNYKLLNLLKTSIYGENTNIYREFLKLC